MKEKISKIKIEGAFGIEEVEITPKSITEITGSTGTGKTSVLDSLKMLLTNKGTRTRYIKNGEKEANLFVMLDNGVEINRTKKRAGTDKITIKEGGMLIDDTPQNFLNKLFSEEQFNPLKFVELKDIEQKKILLSLLDIQWNNDDFLKWFGEIPAEVSEEKHILEILEILGSNKSKWYLDREETGREKRTAEAVKTELFGDIPQNYQPEEWRNVNLSEKYTEIEKKNNLNNQIEKCENFLNAYNEKVENLDNKYALKIKEQKELKDLRISKSEKEKEFDIISENKNIENCKSLNASIDIEIAELLREKLNNEERVKQSQLNIEKIKSNTLQKEQIEKEMQITISGIEEAKKIELEKYIEQKEQAEKYIKENAKQDISKIKEDAKQAEKMKSYIQNWDKAIEKAKEIEVLQGVISSYTDKIEKARILPAELLEQSNLPINGLKLEEGQILILNTRNEYVTVSDLSDGEKMKLAIKIAALKSKELGVVFCDGSEKLDEKTYREFIKECAATGLQFFFTRTTDGEFTVKTYDL